MTVDTGRALRVGLMKMVVRCIVLRIMVHYAKLIVDQWLAELKAVWVVAIGALNTMRVHLALQKRSIHKHLLEDLSICKIVIRMGKLRIKMIQVKIPVDVIIGQFLAQERHGAQVLNSSICEVN